MALISSSKHAGLNDYSNTGGSQRGPGRFKCVHITGKSREGEEVGKLLVVKEYNQEGAADFVINNAGKLRFIMMFMKRIRQMNKKESGRDKTVCFSFSGEDGAVSSSGRECPPGPERKNGWCNECKFQYIFAGVLLDENSKAVKIKNEAGEDETCFIYFRNAGMKFSATIDFLQELEIKGKDLAPLSDDEDYEKNVVLPRRFIIEVTPGKKESEKWGDITVFNYNPIQLLPDEAVEKIIEDSSQFAGDFEKQFDVSKYIRGGGGVASAPPADSIPFSTDEEKKEDVTTESALPKDKPSDVSSDDLAGEIDLGF